MNNYQEIQRPAPEPMIRVGALGYTLGRNPDSMPDNIRPDLSLWNAPDGRELTYSKACEESWRIEAYLVYYLVSGRYVLDHIIEADTSRPAVFTTRDDALIYLQGQLISGQRMSRQFLVHGPAADFHIPNTPDGLKSLNYHLMPALRKTA